MPSFFANLDGSTQKWKRNITETKQKKILYTRQG